MCFYAVRWDDPCYGNIYQDFSAHGQELERKT